MNSFQNSCDENNVKKRYSKMMMYFFDPDVRNDCSKLYEFIIPMLSGKDPELLEYTLKHPNNTNFEIVYKLFQENRLGYENVKCIYNRFIFAWISYYYH